MKRLVAWGYLMGCPAKDCRKGNAGTDGTYVECETCSGKGFVKLWAASDRTHETGKAA